MTMTEEKKIRFQIARVQGVQVCKVFIDKVEELGEKFGCVKFNKTHKKEDHDKYFL